MPAWSLGSVNFASLLYKEKETEVAPLAAVGARARRPRANEVTGGARFVGGNGYCREASGRRFKQASAPRLHENYSTEISL